MDIEGKKIIQIIPADGWLALFRDGQGGQMPVRLWGGS